MNQRLWQKLEKLRSLPLTGRESLAELFKNEGIRFEPKDFETWRKFFSAQFARMGVVIQAPGWLFNVFSALAKDASPSSICDPWAATGFLVESLREVCQPKETLAITPNQIEYDLGKVLAPEVTWQLGEPLHLLDTVTQEFDVVASILPWGHRASNPLKVLTGSGQNVEIKDDKGNLVMVAASLHLSSSGLGLFVVTPSFFFSQHSAFGAFGLLGLGVRAAFALPSGTFAPYTNIPAFLLVISRQPVTRMFVAQLSGDEKTNIQVLDNFKQCLEGGTLELGRFVDPQSFTSLEQIRTVERLEEAERRFNVPSVELANLATSINLGRFGEDFSFRPQDNSLFIPLIGNSAVLESLDDLTLKNQNYAQVVIDPARSNAQFVARFLNSDLGKVLREQSKTGTVIPKLNKQTLNKLRVIVPDLRMQRRMLEIEAQMATEQNTLLGLQNELGELRRELWANPRTAVSIEQRVGGLSKRLGGGLKEHAAKSLDQWFETLPFPLASILRAWQATPSQDFKTRHEHLLHFFEATAEFVSVILLSAFSYNEALFGPHRQKIAEAMKPKLSFEQATFGTWKVVVEYLGKQTRALLSEKGKKPEEAANDRALCADIFADTSLGLAEALSRKELAAVLSTTNKMRNDWRGHGGVVGQQEAQLRNEKLLAEVQKLREAVGDVWSETQLIHALHCLPRQGVFENEVSILMGSNNEFLKETRQMATWLDVERLYLANKDSGRSLKLIPLIQVGPSPQSAKNACYFFSRLEQPGTARFVSYHFADKPELSGNFSDAVDAIKLLTEP